MPSAAALGAACTRAALWGGFVLDYWCGLGSPKSRSAGWDMGLVVDVGRGIKVCACACTMHVHAACGVHGGGAGL